ncbi:hypothetical protein OWV82_016854 [Melia azedarach]|uniref:Uncharacterized protein n=1 Tax=Melia azedarach TaxID=155640 RepID=A0ACC1XK25_MELAZ|nr:hypothetical protein OWV82_016854 [Melia azedarach]
MHESRSSSQLVQVTTTAWLSAYASGNGNNGLVYNVWVAKAAALWLRVADWRSAFARGIAVWLSISERRRRQRTQNYESAIPIVMVMVLGWEEIEFDIVVSDRLHGHQL